MAFDFKKEYKEFYLPMDRPEILQVPPVSYLAVRGKGDPNREDGAYKRALAVLYAVAYTIKMSKMGDHRIDGYFDFVVPPLEGFWWQEGQEALDVRDKAGFHWISVLRLADFVTEEELRWACAEAARKKKLDCSAAELLTVEEGLCVQILHQGAFDEETASIARMEDYARAQGYEIDLSETRRHHEIYLTDARKVPPEKWRTVVRLPIRKA